MSGGYSSDKVTLQDVKTGETYQVIIDQEGIGTLTIDGRIYDVGYYGAADMPQEDRYIWLAYYKDGIVVSSQKVFWENYAVLYPTGKNPDCQFTCAQVLKVSAIQNSSTSYISDSGVLVDTQTNEVFKAVLDSEGRGTLNIRGEAYDLRYFGSAVIDSEYRYITLSRGTSSWKAFKNGYIVFV